MKAIRLHARGGPEQLVYEDAPMPEPAYREVRIRVHAAAITPTELTWDESYQYADGRPRIPAIPGHDVSGVVESIGRAAIGLKVGDEVFGLIDFPHDGSFAEFVCAPAADLAPKPRTLDHIHAAAVPLSALTAWQALFEHGDLEPGQRVLIHGAAGGVGGFAVQMARSRGAHLIATASPRHAESLRALGVNEIIDYTSVQFESAVSNMDLVFDTVGGQTQERSFQTLRRGGRLISIAAPPVPAKPLEAGVDAMFFIVRPNRSQLIEIGKLIDAGKLKVAVQSVFPLSRTKEAFDLAAAGHLRGKIVVQVVQ